MQERRTLGMMSGEHALHNETPREVVESHIETDHLRPWESADGH